jgi:predicted Rossmann fold flavoprotein
LATNSTDADVIVIGAGAAGLMCAIEAGKRGRRVIVLEHADRTGKKILISGGGRCNFTNIHCRPENFLSVNPHFCKSALARFTPADFIEMVSRHKIRYHEKKLGQLFCDNSAHEITRMLDGEASRAGVRTVLRCAISEVQRDTAFIVDSNCGRFAAPALVVATGGLSIPKIGATSFGYDLARRFGLKIVPCRPALVPLTFNERDRADWSALAGVAADANVFCGSVSFQERMLITHRGLSGPAILQISSYWSSGRTIVIDLMPDAPNAGAIPRRLLDRWRDLHPAAEAGTGLREWEIEPAGTEGYAKAEVTAGGIHPDELSSKTMESRRVPGLYFIGEVVDVTGHLGGFNFQWAWASGYAAGQAV